MSKHTRTRLDRLRLADLDPQDQIAPNFKLYELSHCVVAERLAIDNRLPDDATLRAAVHLAREVMQPIRDGFGRFTPINVYRCQALERLLKHRPPGWISLSPHTGGWACDLRIPGYSTLALAEWALAHLPAFDEIQCENVDPRLGPSSGWVHIALRPPGQGENRRQVQSQVRDPEDGRWVLLPRLTDHLG